MLNEIECRRENPLEGLYGVVTRLSNKLREIDVQLDIAKIMIDKLLRRVKMLRRIIDYVWFKENVAEVVVVEAENENEVVVVEAENKNEVVVVREECG
ncbi:hypothetical protein Tco_1062794 [Tanacetum coccineum]